MTTSLSSQKYYISSADRTSGSNQSFRIPIRIPPNSGYDHIVVIDASIPLSFYVTDYPYNEFLLTEGVSVVDIVIPSGNYNINTFKTSLTSLLNALSPNGWTYAMTFDTLTGKYTWTVTDNSGIQPKFTFGDFLVSQMGFGNDSINSFVGNSLTSTDAVSFVATPVIFIRCDLVSDESNILQTIFTNNNIPYSCIPYTCTNIEHYAKKLTTTLHSEISLSLVDGRGQEIILNGNDWFVEIMLFKKDNLTDMFKSFLNFVYHYVSSGEQEKYVVPQEVKGGVV